MANKVEKLKALLEALDLMQDEEDWTPTPKQWTRIRTLIEDLDEESAVVAEAPVRYVGGDRPGAGPRPAPAAGQPRSNPWADGTARMPEIPSSIPEGAERLAPTGGSALAPQGGSALRPAGPVANPNQPVGMLEDGTAVHDSHPGSPGL